MTPAPGTGNPRRSLLVSRPISGPGRLPGRPLRGAPGRGRLGYLMMPGGPGL